MFKVDINQVFSFECEVNGVKIKHNESKGRGWETCASGQVCMYMQVDIVP